VQDSPLSTCRRTLPLRLRRPARKIFANSPARTDCGRAHRATRCVARHCRSEAARCFPTGPPRDTANQHRVEARRLAGHDRRRRRLDIFRVPISRRPSRHRGTATCPHFPPSRNARGGARCAGRFSRATAGGVSQRRAHSPFCPREQRGNRVRSEEDFVGDRRSQPANRSSALTKPPPQGRCVKI